MNKNISFVKTTEEINEMMQTDGGWFYGQEKMQMAWIIPNDIYQKLLPPGLEPVAPIVYCFIGAFLRPATLYPYSEGGLFILASHNGRVGAYCLSMPVDSYDQAISSGREFYGYPKKCAKISLVRSGDLVKGYVERNDIRFFEFEAHLGAYNVESQEALSILPLAKPGTKKLEGVYLLNGDWRIINGINGVKDIKLVWQKNNVEVLSQIPASVQLKFKPSEDDPWIEISPLKVIGGQYTTYNTQMLDCDIVKEYTKEEYPNVIPHMFRKWDTWLFGKIHSNY